MEIDHFKEFVVLAQIGNFQKAAEDLFISQPTLTRHIKMLEKDLGVKVFDRTTRRIELSEYGQFLLPYAKEMVRLKEEFTGGIINLLKDTEKVLAVGSIPSMTPYRITDLLAEFNLSNPSCSINVIEENTTGLIRYLNEGKCDFAFLRSDNSSDEFHKIAIAYDKMVALFPPKHPLANKEAISVEQLKDENLLFLKGDLFYKRLIEDYGHVNDRPRMSFTGTRVENIIDLVGKGMGVSLVLNSSVRLIHNHDVSVINIKPDIVMDISLTYSKKKKLNPVSTLFLEFVKQWASKNA